MVIVSVDVFGEKQVERELLRLSDAAMDMRPAGARFMEYMRSVERQQFDSEGRTGSGGWAPLKPRTAAQKAARGLDPRILRAHDELRKSLTNKGHPNHIEQISADEFFFATRDPKAKFHQGGTRKMPARRVIDLAERNRRKIVKIVQEHLIGRDR
jgi:phage gpG-like protein